MPLSPQRTFPSESRCYMIRVVDRLVKLKKQVNNGDSGLDGDLFNRAVVTDNSQGVAIENFLSLRVPQPDFANRFFGPDKVSEPEHGQPPGG